MNPTTPARIGDLNPLQARIWRAARAYAKSELTYSAVEEEYRSTGDPQLMPWAEAQRQRAASRLFQLIQSTMMVDAEE